MSYESSIIAPLKLQCVITAPVFPAPGTPILDAIEAAMAGLIAGMQIANGFNFDWSIVNEQDQTIGDFPRCVINPTDGRADLETSQDTTEGLGSLDYTNEVIYTILINGELPAFSENPLFEIRFTLRQALDDLKMLFGEYLNLGGACDNIMYAASQIEPLAQNDGQRAAQLRTFWKVIYSQDRLTPSQYAGS